MLDLTGRSGDYVVLGDNADVLPKLPDQSFQLIYIDPPFNTGKVQQRLTLQTRRSENGDRIGFGGRSYVTVETGRKSYGDEFDDYLGFIGPRLEESRRLLTDDGPSTSTSTSAKLITARSFSTRSSAGTAF